eukprot:15340648-Ditylum_brightwellii.AAC.1
MQGQAPSLTLDPSNVHDGSNGRRNDHLLPTTPHTSTSKSTKNRLLAKEEPIESPHRKNVCNMERLECSFEDGYSS